MRQFVFGARYPLPPEVAIRAQLDLPATLAGDKLALHFARDTKVGAALVGIEHRDVSGTFTFRCGLPSEGVVVASTGEVTDGGLWAMRLTTQRGDKVTLAPRDALEFAAYTATGLEGEPAFLLVWGGLQVPGAPDYDQLGVMVLVSLAPEDEVSRWRAWVARARGGSASIDAFDLPVLAVRGPMEPREGETHFDAQTRARFLLPSSLGPLSGLASTNLPLWLWLLGTTVLRRGVFEALHPSAEQLLQFTTVYAADPAQPASYRRMLYCGSEDRDGYYKRFRYGGALVAAGTDLEAYWSWSVTFVPGFDDPIGATAGAAAGPATTEWANTLVTPYPVVVGALRARTDAYWYDACAFYRAFVERSGIGGARASERVGSGLAGTAELFSASIQLTPARLRGPTLYRRILELHRLWMRVVANPYVSTATSHMHMQTYTSTDVYVGDVAEYPLDLSIGEGVREMLAEALELGVRTSPYVFPGDLKEGSTWTPFLPPEAVAYDRDGQPQGFVAVPVIAPGATGRGPRIDYGAGPGQRFFPTLIIKALVEEVGFGGMYNDVFSGSGASLTYDPPPPLASQHTAHGGEYWTRGKVRAIQLEREVLEMLGPGSEESRRQRSFVLGETAEEFVSPHLDRFQHGYDWMPGHTLLAEEVIFGTAVSPPEIPLDAKNMAPALWDLVYHEWAPAVRFTIPLTDLPLARNAEVFPDGPYPGMSGDEWRDLVCFVFATNFAFGLGMNFLDYLNRDSPLVRVEGDQLVVEPTVDPDGVGLVVAAFLARLFGAQEEAYAGRFARLGRMERPLSVDWARWPAATRPNPVEACIKTPPSLAAWSYPSSTGRSTSRAVAARGSSGERWASRCPLCCTACRGARRENSASCWSIGPPPMARSSAVWTRRCTASASNKSCRSCA